MKSFYHCAVAACTIACLQVSFANGGEISKRNTINGHRSPVGTGGSEIGIGSFEVRAAPAPSVGTISGTGGLATGVPIVSGSGSLVTSVATAVAGTSTGKPVDSCSVEGSFTSTPESFTGIGAGSVITPVPAVTLVTDLPLACSTARSSA
ncbi:hypothetical protein MVEN_01289900 [Mycena venus]|uniref:Uncharacterized protein n=1 Tax=Mycena venus TaxID=2733690 RepID=A0A8H6XX79_9AGAR|nr:hypothetical protein MVEN_01289900 [Mycena venus]